MLRSSRPPQRLRLDRLSGASTLVQNRSGANGGAVASTLAPVELTNVTVTANAADGSGGGVYVTDASTNLRYVTLLNNRSGNGANLAASGLTSFGSVVALPGGGGTNCAAAGDATSQGHNFADDASCGFTDNTDTQNGDDPQVAVLAEHDGPTRTRMPSPASPLVDAIATDNCHANITVDQRRVDRPQGDGCDIGAAEADPDH